MFMLHRYKNDQPRLSIAKHLIFLYRFAQARNLHSSLWIFFCLTGCVVHFALSFRYKDGWTITKDLIWGKRQICFAKLWYYILAKIALQNRWRLPAAFSKCGVTFVSTVKKVYENIRIKSIQTLDGKLSRSELTFERPCDLKYLRLRNLFWNTIWKAFKITSKV